MTDTNVAFNYQMPPEYVSSTEDVINSLGIKIEAPVLFCHIYNMLSENGKKKNITPYDVFSFLLTCQKLGLNPMLKQIYGFESRGKVVTIISVDGWIEIANRHPQYDGSEYEYAEPVDKTLSYNKVTFDNGFRKVTTVSLKRKVSDWMRCKIYRKDRSHPIVFTTFFDEANTGTEPWATMPMQMLQNRAMVNAIKKAFGVNAYTPDDRSYDMPTYQEVMETADIHQTAAIESQPAPQLTNNDQGSSLLAGMFTPQTETEPVKKKRASRKAKEVTAEPVPASTEPLPPEPVLDAEQVPIPTTPPLPPLPEEQPQIQLSKTAIDLAQMINGADNRTKLQFYGNVIAQFKDLPESDRAFLRKLYSDKMETLDE